MRKLFSYSTGVCALFSLFIFSSFEMFGQEILDDGKAYVQQNLNEWGLAPEDIENWILQDYYFSATTGLYHIYWKQTYEGIPVENAILNMNLYENGEVLSVGNRFIPNLANTQSGVQQLDARTALLTVANTLEIPLNSPELLSVAAGPSLTTLFDKGEVALEPIKVERVYLKVAGGVRLAWKVQLYTKDASTWWQVMVDAEHGTVLQRFDQVIHCTFDHAGYSQALHDLDVHGQTLGFAAPRKINRPHAPDAYRVFPLGVESPNHGGRSLVVNPADLIASTFGWHDTDGVDGAEFTTTQGNNVWAVEDRDANNTGGFSPDGGPSLDFDFDLDFNQNITENSPVPNESAAITNLFYWNNIIHDIFYRYGFDEAAGNFQDNNYGNGGIGGDYVFADAQDGSGLRNANFATPTDGGNGRMQMFLWGSPTGAIDVTVNAPAGISGTYSAVADDNAPGYFNIDAEVILADDGTVNGAELCNPAVNGGDLNGKIALIEESNTCTFFTQVVNAQDEGAVAVIIIKDGAGNPTVPSTGLFGIFFVNIPAVMLSEADGLLLKTEIENGNTVTVNMKPQGDFIDGDFDNGIIAHEYGHGISTRLTGGPGANTCLQNEEQAGEGWSDWFGIVLTHQASDTRNTSRGIGTYALEQAISGPGIRTYPYSTDMTVNPHTYDAIKDVNLSVPHGVGSVFAVMLYDLYWNLIDQHGYDPDLYTGTGGNNIAIQLVIDGLKLQPCSPGFVDMRDAILAADQANNAGANEALIWQTFARRGLGYSAIQGDSDDRTDGTEAFDLPPGSLPVELISFGAKAGQREVILDWETSFEQNNRGFDIQRFDPNTQEFLSLGWVAGAGDTDTGNPYQFRDATVAPGKRYTYRLKQMDFDGAFSYSNSLSVELNSSSLTEVSLYPNPLSEDQLQVDLLNWNVRTTLNIKIYDSLGRKVLEESYNKDKTQTSILVPLPKLGPGLYTVNVQAGNTHIVEKFLKR